MSRRGRIPSRPTNGVRTVDEQYHLGGEVRVVCARLDEELANEFLASTQMRERSLTNGMAGVVDLERGIDERASSLRLCAQGVLDYVEERQDRQFAGFLGAAPRASLEAKECPSASLAQRFRHELILGAEVLVQGPLRHPCLRRDRVHSRARDPARIGQLTCRSKECVVRVRPVCHSGEYTYRSVYCDLRANPRRKRKALGPRRRMCLTPESHRVRASAAASFKTVGIHRSYRPRRCLRRFPVAAIRWRSIPPLFLFSFGVAGSAAPATFS